MPETGMGLLSYPFQFMMRHLQNPYFVSGETKAQKVEMTHIRTNIV